MFATLLHLYYLKNLFFMFKNYFFRIFLMFPAFSAFGQANWTFQNPLPQSNGLHTVQVINDQIAYLGSSWTGMLLKTSNGGLDWSILKTDVYKTGVDGFDFYDENLGLIPAGLGKIKKTLNGGQTFSTVDLPLPEILIYSIKFKTSNEIIAGFL